MARASSSHLFYQRRLRGKLRHGHRPCRGRPAAALRARLLGRRGERAAVQAARVWKASQQVRKHSQQCSTGTSNRRETMLSSARRRDGARARGPRARARRPPRARVPPGPTRRAPRLSALACRCLGPDPQLRPFVTLARPLALFITALRLLLFDGEGARQLGPSGASLTNAAAGDGRLRGSSSL